MTVSSPRSALPVGAIPAGVAFVLCLAAVALFWPGIAMYDTVAQYGQVVSGVFDDWHPPVMARLWSVLHGFIPVSDRNATAPMFVLQMGLYWSGLGALSAALARLGKPRCAAAMLLVGGTPLFLGWQGTVLKDAQMLGAMLAAVGLVAWWRLPERRVPAGGWLLVAVLLGYATLVRANAVFATVALIVMLVGPRNWLARAVVALAGVGVVLAVSPTINHGLLGAASSGVERTEAIYDLSAIAVRSPGVETGLSLAAVRTIASRHCVKPYFWDPLGEPTRCADAVEILQAQPGAALYRTLAAAVVRAPGAYITHRLAHWNSTERWLIGAGGVGALPPAAAQPNDLGLVGPGRGAAVWQTITRMTVDTPLGWPIAFYGVALVALVVALRRREWSATLDLARALLVSAVLLETSFLVLSIASDLRYHLWSMVATTLGVILLVADRRPSSRAMLAGGMVLLGITASGVAARVILPPLPATYTAQLL